MREVWDRIGISASLLCVLHCLATPALVLFMPILNETVSSHVFHHIIVWVVVPLAVWALLNGYRLHHQRRVLVLGLIGIALIFAAHYFEHQHKLEVALMIVAGLVLAAAHLTNLRACRSHH